MIHLDQLVFTPLPQLRLKQALIRGGHYPSDITILEYRRDGSIQAMLDEIIQLKPDVVGFSCYTWNFIAVERLSVALKAYSPAITVIWGGPHVSECAERFLAKYTDSVDLIITWFGETTFTKSMQMLEVGSTPSEISMQLPGSWTPGCGKHAVEYPHLASLGYPYDFMPRSVTDNIANRVFLIESFRGCPWSCAYCLWGQAEKKYPALSAQEMKSQMYRMVEDGARIFMYADAGLGLMREDGQQRDLAVYQGFVDDRILMNAGAQIRGYFFWQTLNDDMLDVIAELIKQGVMGQLDIGIQTFNKAVLQDLMRPTNYDKFFDTIERLHKHDIRFSLDLILGLPGDTLEGFKESLRKVIKCRPDRTQSFPLSILPGTGYDLRRDELGIKTIRGSYRDDAETIIATKTMPYKDMLEALELEAWMFLYYAEGLFAKTLNFIAERDRTDELDVLVGLKDWSSRNAPHLYALAEVYRSKLYDSRSDGRYALEQLLMDTFVEVYKELLMWAGADDTEAGDIMHDELLAFPKTKEVASDLQGIGDIVYTDGVLARWFGEELCQYKWRQDPVIGAIVRNRNFYTWQRLGEDVSEADLSISDDLLQGAKQ